MADSNQQPGGQPPIPNDGGPQPPTAPVQPGSGSPFTDPSTNPSAPVNAPSPTTGAPPAPPEPGSDAAATLEARTAMADGDPGSFLANFLAGEGLSLLPEGGSPTPAGTAATPQGQQPSVQPPANGVGAQAPQPANGAAPTGQQGVDPALLQRLMQGPPAAQAPAPAWPTMAPQQGQPPAPTAYAAPQQPAPDPNAPPVLFNEAFQLPDQIVAAMDHADPRVRATAIGAAMAAAANTTAQRVIAYMRSTDLPQVAQATMGQFQQHQFRETVNRELYGNFPHLRYAAPQLIQQAANVIVQDELSRNPGAQLTQEIWRKIGTLASAGLQQMAGGQAPVFAPPVQAQAPAYYPPAQPQSAPVWNGQAWIMPPAPTYPLQPQQQAPTPWVAGQSGQPFGMSGPAAITPESEFASFMNGGWERTQ